MEQSDALATGTLVDRYKIESVLGIGGFGITYKAFDTKLHGYVAIKEFLPGTLANRDGATKTVVPKSHSIDIYSHCLNAFVDEARRLNQLHHPNVVGVLNFVEQYGTAYIVMKFEEGESMDLSLARMKGTSVAEKDIMTVLVPILKGLKAVHDAGMLHRDIKPGNIFIRDNGEPMLIDFGAARQEVGGYTKTMTAMVSMGFAPPEQYSSEGKRQGTWSDIYAVGAMVYKMVTGITPTDATERQTALFDNEPDPLTPLSQHPKAKGYSKMLLDAVNDSLQVSAKARPQSVSEILSRFGQENTKKTEGELDKAAYTSPHILKELEELKEFKKLKQLEELDDLQVIEELEKLEGAKVRGGLSDMLPLIVSSVAIVAIVVICMVLFS